MFVFPKQALRMLQDGACGPVLEVCGDLIHDAEGRNWAWPRRLVVHGDVGLSGSSALPETVVTSGDFRIRDCPELETFPSRLTIGGSLVVKDCLKLKRIRCSMDVRGSACFEGSGALEVIGLDARIGSDLDLGQRADGCAAPWGMPLRMLAGRIHVGRHLKIQGCAVRSLPAGLRVRGTVDASGCRDLQEIGPDLTVGQDLILRCCWSLREIRQDVRVGRDLCVSGVLGDELAFAEGLKVGGYFGIDTSYASFRLSDGLRVGKSLRVANCTGFAGLGSRTVIGEHAKFTRCAPLPGLPEDLSVGGSLTIDSCAALRELPQSCGRIPVDIIVSGCGELRSLPDELEAGGDIKITSCPSLEAMPSRVSAGGSLKVGWCDKIESIGSEVSVGGDLEVISCGLIESLPEGLRVPGSLVLVECRGLKGLSESLTVGRDLVVEGSRHLERLPWPRLTVAGRLSLAGCSALHVLPDPLVVQGGFDVSCTPVETLPERLWVGGSVVLEGCRKLGSIPYRCWKVEGSLEIRACVGLTELPEGLMVRDNLRACGCRALQRLPAGLMVGRDLELTECSALMELPEGLFVGDCLIRECSGVMTLPVRFHITSFFDSGNRVPLGRYTRLDGRPILQRNPAGDQGREPFDWVRLQGGFPAMVKVWDENPDEKVGALLSMRTAVPEGLWLLRVRCATTGRYHVLRVPHWVRHAKQANAWTWDLDSNQYQPQEEA